MIIIIETVILCIAFFLICFWGTGTDNKNLKSYSSYPDEVQNRIKSIAEYQGKFKESNKVVTFSQNLYGLALCGGYANIRQERTNVSPESFRRWCSRCRKSHRFGPLPACPG